MCVCAHSCARACVCVHAHVCVCVCMFVYMFMLHRILKPDIFDIVRLVPTREKNIRNSK